LKMEGKCNGRITTKGDYLSGANQYNENITTTVVSHTS